MKWTNWSDAATTVEIQRAELDASGAPGAWSVLTSVPAQNEPFGSSYVDRVVAVGTAYRYRVAVAAGSHRSASVEMTSLRLGTPLATATAQLPIAPVVATDGKGNYAFASSRGGFHAQELSFVWGNGTAWNIATGIVATPFAPFVKLDAAGLPHTVYGKPATSGTGVVITPRMVERNAVARGADRGAHGRRGPDQTVAAVRPRRGGQSRDGLEPRRPEVRSCDQGGGRVGGGAARQRARRRIHALQCVHRSNRRASRARRHVPHSVAPRAQERCVDSRGSAADAGADYSCIGAGRDPDHLTVCGSLPSDSIVLQGWLTLSPDGTRLGALYRGANTHVYRSELGGPWTDVIVSPRLPRDRLAIGFDAAGKFFVLSGGGDFPGEVILGDYQLEREP